MRTETERQAPRDWACVEGCDNPWPSPCDWATWNQPCRCPCHGWIPGFRVNDARLTAAGSVGPVEGAAEPAGASTDTTTTKGHAE